MILTYFIISFINVFLHIARSILVIKSSKLIASLANCICYTFSAVVIKFIAEVDLWIAICVQATTNFFGCYVAMLVCEKYLNKEQRKTLKVMCDWNDEEADAQSILVLYQKHFVMKTDVIDWLNENHFDYRGLIEQGLAIDATGLNIY